MKSAFGALAFILLLSGCVTDSGPQYSLSGGEKGVFTSRNPARRSRSTASRASTKGSSRRCSHRRARPQGRPAARCVTSPDACSLFVYLYRRGGTDWKAEYADAYDLQLRPLPVDQCAGSVAAQKRRVA